MPERSPDNYSQSNTAIHTDRLVVHDTALIATSAQLQASAPHRIEIGAGVVIGEGCWLHACSGDIIIESGAVLGVGVLIVGWSKIGALSIIGSAVTIFEAVIDSGVTIATHSVRGLPERDISLVSPVADTFQEVDNLTDPWDDADPFSANSSGETIETQIPVAAPIPAPTPAPIPTPQPASGLKIPLTSSPFIRSWKRPTVDPVVNPVSLPAEPSDHPTPPPAVERTPPQTNVTIDEKTASVNDTQPPPSDTAPPTAQDVVSADSEQHNNPRIDQPQNPEAGTTEIIEEITITRSISQPHNVYGRQYVNRIIDSILQRNTPET